MSKLGDVRVREFVHPDGFCDAKVWNVEVYAKPSGRYATPESEPVWLCVNPTIEPFTVKEYAEQFAERYADKARIAELEAQLKDCGGKLLEARADALNTTLEVDRLNAQLKAANELISDAVSELTDAPEINPCNYDHDQVCRLNTQCVYVLSFFADYVNTIGGKDV